MQFCQAPNCYFERSHRGKVQHSESNPGNENRRLVLCPPLPRLKAVQLDTGLRKCWQQHQDSCTTYVFWNDKNGYQYKVWPEERLQECYVLCLYLQMAPVWDVLLTKLEIPVRICTQLRKLFLLLCPVLSLPDGFPPNQTSALPSGSPV